MQRQGYSNMEMNQLSQIQRGSERHSITTKIEFMVYGDVEEATSIDISETGLRFETSKPLLVRMRAQIQEQKKEYLAELVWAKRKPTGETEYGFRFVPDIEKQDF